MGLCEPLLLYTNGCPSSFDNEGSQRSLLSWRRRKRLALSCSLLVSVGLPTAVVPAGIMSARLHTGVAIPPHRVAEEDWEVETEKGTCSFPCVPCMLPLGFLPALVSWEHQLSNTSSPCRGSSFP